MNKKHIYIYIGVHTSPPPCIWLTLHSPISGAVYIETIQGSSVFQLLVSSLAASIRFNYSVRVRLCLLVEVCSTVGVTLVCGTTCKSVYKHNGCV
jgi:hypothetical protein